MGCNKQKGGRARSLEQFSKRESPGSKGETYRYHPFPESSLRASKGNKSDFIETSRGDV